MPYYPIFLNIEGKTCLVVGGGAVAERKVRSLLDCGARVRVVSPALTPELAELAEAGRIDAVHREYRKGDVAGSGLAIAATDERSLNGRVAAEAGELGIQVNVVDDPELSSFIVPSLFRRGDITIAISTGGRSPALAKKVRLTLEELFPEDLGELAGVISEARQELKAKGAKVDTESWQAALALDELLALIGAGKRSEAKERILKRLERVS